MPPKLSNGSAITRMKAKKTKQQDLAKKRYQSLFHSLFESSTRLVSAGDLETESTLYLQFLASMPHNHEKAEFLKQYIVFKRKYIEWLLQELAKTHRHLDKVPYYSVLGQMQTRTLNLLSDNQHAMISIPKDCEDYFLLRESFRHNYSLANTYNVCASLSEYKLYEPGLLIASENLYQFCLELLRQLLGFQNRTVSEALYLFSQWNNIYTNLGNIKVHAGECSEGHIIYKAGIDALKQLLEVMNHIKGHSTLSVKDKQSSSLMVKLPSIETVYQIDPSCPSLKTHKTITIEILQQLISLQEGAFKEALQSNLIESGQAYISLKEKRNQLTTLYYKLYHRYKATHANNIDMLNNTSINGADLAEMLQSCITSTEELAEAFLDKDLQAYFLETLLFPKVLKNDVQQLSIKLEHCKAEYKKELMAQDSYQMVVNQENKQQEILEKKQLLFSFKENNKKSPSPLQEELDRAITIKESNNAWGGAFILFKTLISESEKNADFEILTQAQMHACHCLISGAQFHYENYTKAPPSSPEQQRELSISLDKFNDAKILVEKILAQPKVVASNSMLILNCYKTLEGYQRELQQLQECLAIPKQANPSLQEEIDNPYYQKILQTLNQLQQKKPMDPNWMIEEELIKAIDISNAKAPSLLPAKTYSLVSDYFMLQGTYEASQEYNYETVIPLFDKALYYAEKSLTLLKNFNGKLAENLLDLAIYAQTLQNESLETAIKKIKQSADSFILRRNQVKAQLINIGQWPPKYSSPDAGQKARAALALQEKGGLENLSLMEARVKELRETGALLSTYLLPRMSLF